MTPEPDREELAPADDSSLSGEDRFAMDDEARDATKDLTPEEQEALLTQMRRHVERGLSDAEAWRRAYAEVRGHEVPLAREGEEGALRGERPVEALDETSYAEPGTVEADRSHDREPDRK